MVTRVNALLLLPLVVVFACSGSSPTAPPASTPTPTPAPTATPSPSAMVLRAATFAGSNGYSTSGNARVVQEGSSYRLDLLDDFLTNNSGALEVRLCTDPSCGGAQRNLGSLTASSGRQSYALADAASEFGSVVIWCRGVNLAFGFGVLR